MASKNTKPTQKMKYQWKPGTDNTSLDPELAAGELDRIQEENDGMLTAGVVLENSRDTDSALHGYFEWNNKKASEKYRLWQARYLINHLEVVVKRVETDPVTIRVYTNILTTEGRGYFRTDVLIQNKDTARIVLENAWAELQKIRRKYNDLREFNTIFRAMDKVREREELPSMSA